MAALPTLPAASILFLKQLRRPLAGLSTVLLAPLIPFRALCLSRLRRMWPEDDRRVLNDPEVEAIFVDDMVNAFTGPLPGDVSTTPASWGGTGVSAERIGTIGAHGQGSGAEVGAGRAPGRCPSSSDRISGSRKAVSTRERACYANTPANSRCIWLVYQASESAMRVNIVTPSVSATSHLCNGRAPLSESAACSGQQDDFGELAANSTAVAADIVEGQGVVDPGMRGHPTLRRRPLSGRYRNATCCHEVNVIRLAMLQVEPSTDVRLTHPPGDGLQIVIGEAEPGEHRGRPVPKPTASRSVRSARCR